MKHLTLLLLALTSLVARASDDVVIAEGVRVGLSKSLLSARMSTDDGAMSINVPEIAGVALGYASIKENALGFTAGVHDDVLQRSVTLLKAEANATYGFARGAYVFAGANATTVTGSLSGATPGVGAQIGVGENFTAHWGADLQFNYENFETTAVDVSLNGFELRLHYTF